MISPKLYSYPNPDIRYPPEKISSMENKGFAKFNNGYHLCVDVPDGNFTISAKTSSGKRVTFAFAPYTKDGEAGCVDVVYHDSGGTVNNGEKDIPTFKSIGFGMGKWNSEDKDNTIVSVVLDDETYEKMEAANV
jgi:hypothetical protein